MAATATDRAAGMGEGYFDLASGSEDDDDSEEDLGAEGWHMTDEAHGGEGTPARPPPLPAGLSPFSGHMGGGRASPPPPKNRSVRARL